MIRNAQVLLVQRGHEPFLGWWSLPGGVVETGEALQDAVRRELLEETGITVEPLSVVEIFESIRRNDEGHVAFHYVVIDYVCKFISGELQAADDASGAQWFDADALPQSLTPGAEAVIRKAFTWVEDNRRDTLKE